MTMSLHNSGLYRFSVGFEQAALLQGIKIPVSVNFGSVPHLSLVAPSGAGKTTLLTLILKQLAMKPITLILADFKGVDFMALDGCRNYYKHSSVAEALGRVFRELQERMAHPRPEYTPMYLCIDEWSGFLSLYPKKEQEQHKQHLASILMLGRGVSIFCIVALQRIDASYITGRDNIGNCIGLGRLSPESIRMQFPDNTDQILPKSRGHGYLRVDGKPLQELVVPRIRDPVKTMGTIRAALE